MKIVETKYVKFEVNEVCDLAQDSFYTRNPEDSAVTGDIGPNSPESIFVKTIQLIKMEDLSDGDVWYHAKVEHDGIWEIYTDTAVGGFVKSKLADNGHNFGYVNFSEQGMQQNGLADMDVA